MSMYALLCVSTLSCSTMLQYVNHNQMLPESHAGQSQSAVVLSKCQRLTQGARRCYRIYELGLLFSFLPCV